MIRFNIFIKKRKIDLNKIYLLVGTPFILNKYYNISIIEK